MSQSFPPCKSTKDGYSIKSRSVVRHEALIVHLEHETHAQVALRPTIKIRGWSLALPAILLGDTLVRWDRVCHAWGTPPRSGGGSVIGALEAAPVIFVLYGICPGVSAMAKMEPLEVSGRPCTGRLVVLRINHWRLGSWTGEVSRSRSAIVGLGEVGRRRVGSHRRPVRTIRNVWLRTFVIDQLPVNGGFVFLLVEIRRNQRVRTTCIND